MKKILSCLASLAVVLGLVTVAGSPAQAATTTWTMSSPFAREVVRVGDVDLGPYAINHVYEVQYRLRWLGLFDATPSGYFGPRTKAAVVRFQKLHHLPQTGVVDRSTWPSLIRHSVRGRSQVPSICKTAGWHACYDRWHHQVNLYNSGALLNSWLVRGGGYYTPTRLGNFKVFLRDIDHYSTTFNNAPMPYSQFFSGGEALHGSRYMVDPFSGHSHGCINMWVKDARQLWNLTSTRNLHVHVYGAWS
jgi:hypothetical protein